MRSWNDYKETFRSETDLFDLARVGDLRGLAELLGENPELNLDIVTNRGYSALMLAVYNGEYDFSEALLRGGADVVSRDFVGNTVLMASAYIGDLKFVTLLLEYGADVSLKNKIGMTARDWAQTFARREVLEFFDEKYPSEVVSSRLKNFIQLLRLGLSMGLKRLGPS